jgi:3-dehydroquinate synthase
MNIILYGPPGSGKTAVGYALARRLEREFVDSDSLVEASAGRAIPEIFEQSGEAEFRRLEAEACAEVARRPGVVAALGGGALLNPANRAALERTGLVLCLRAEPAEMLARLKAEGNRPLVAGDDPEAKLASLLEARRELYASFSAQVDTSGKSVEAIAEEIENLLEPRTLRVDAPGLRHEIVLGYGLLERLPALLAERGLDGSVALVTDENVASCLAPLPDVPTLRLPPGEAQKNLDTARQVYDFCLANGLDRRSLLIALGGGVIGDLTGFAAATYMRGIRLVNVPTTLLAMVDASLGGKTGVDLPQGKNLVGAFHPPVVVISDLLLLNTLPSAERVSGMAEVVKHGLIGDAALFEEIEAAPKSFGSLAQMQRAIEVKVRVVEADPFEKGQRAALNLGHTIGHGVEAASGFAQRHGEAVAIGTAAEARLAAALGLCEPNLPGRIEAVLQSVGLPVRCPGLEPQAIRQAMSADKKKASGRLKFALPKRVGEVVWGVEVEEVVLMETLRMIIEV